VHWRQAQESHDKYEITPIHFWIAFGIVRLTSVKPSCSPGFQPHAECSRRIRNQLIGDNLVFTGLQHK